MTQGGRGQRETGRGREGDKEREKKREMRAARETERYSKKTT